MMVRTYIIYNLTLFFTIIFSIWVTHSKNKSSEYIARILVFFSVAIPAYIRKGIGTDYPGYVHLYQRYRHLDDDHELGFKILAKLCWLFDATPHTFIAILAIIPLALIVFYVPKRHYDYFVPTYILTSYLKIIAVSRQEVAIAFAICGIIALEKKYGTIKYLLNSTMACLFHSSSIFYYPILLLKKVEIGPRSIMVLLIIVFTLTLGANVIDWIVTNPMFLASKYSKYLGNDYYFRDTELGSGLGVIANLILPILFLIFYKRSSKYVNNANFICWLTLCFLASYLMSTQTYIFTRLIDVFRFIPAFIAYPTCKAISKRHPFIIFLGFMFMYFVIFNKAVTEAQVSLHRGLGISPFYTIFD